MSTTHWGRLAVLALLVGVATSGMAEQRLELGRGESWAGMSVRDSIETRRGRWGALDLRLRDAAYEPAEDTDLLLHFDEIPFRDAAGRYETLSTGAAASGTTRVLGGAAAVFTAGGGGLRLEARRGALFWPGVVWRDFTIEFWLYPATLGEGETLLSWSGSGIDGSVVRDQSLTAGFRGRRLVFRFDGLFSTAPVLELAGETPLVPRQWHHHLVRFDARMGLLEYLVDGRPEAVRHATPDGHEGGSLSTPLIVPGPPAPLVIGGGLTGLVDELRISRSWVDRPVLAPLDGRVGQATSRVFDLRLGGTRVLGLDAVYDRPGDTEVYFYYRMGNTLKDRGEVDADWIQVAPGREPPAASGRYLQLRVELLPDGTLRESPSVSSITVRYEPDLPPAPPARLLARSGDGVVALSWSRVNESDVAGYRVYWGARPGVYDGVVDVGNVTEHAVSGLENGRLYYFTVATYDHADPTRRSAFAPEVGGRPTALAAG